MVRVGLDSVELGLVVLDWVGLYCVGLRTLPQYLCDGESWIGLGWVELGLIWLCWIGLG